MIDADWFFKICELAIDSAEHWITSDHSERTLYAKGCMRDAWAYWLNVHLMVKADVIELTEMQEREYTYIKLKFAQFSAYMPDVSHNVSLQ